MNEYGSPSAPPGKKPLNINGDTRSGNVFVALTPFTSVTVTWIGNAPSSTGVPQISASSGAIQGLVVPLPVRIDRPNGSPLADHVKGAVPPESTAMAGLHCTPKEQSLKELPYGMTQGNAGRTPITSIDIVFVYDAWLTLSRTVTLKEYRPGPVFADPDIVPEEENTRPFGSPPFVENV